MKRVIGIGVMITGLFIGTYHFIEWKMGRSAAEEMSKVEKEQYTPIENQPVQKEVPATNTSEYKPSSLVPHEQGEKIALLIIPKIGQKFSVYWGADKAVLRKGVGMYVSPFTTAPDGGGHTVLSGHRDTIFYRLDEVKEKEMIKLEYDGVIHTYKITKIWITTPEDRTVIVEKLSPTLTITTCYPFNYIGNAPKRYIIQAERLYEEVKNAVTSRSSHFL